MNRNDYIIVNGELYHYGVPGMRWGRRKKYVTIRQASKNARNAREEARKEAIEKGYGKGIGGLRRVNEYGKAAAKASIANDVLANKKARLENKTKKQPTQEEAKAKAAKGKKIALGVLAGIGAVGIGAAAAYGISKAKKSGKPKVSSFDPDDVLDGMSILPKKDRGRMSTISTPTLTKGQIIDDALDTLSGVAFWLDVFN